MEPRRFLEINRTWSATEEVFVGIDLIPIHSGIPPWLEEKLRTGYVTTLVKRFILVFIATSLHP